MRAAAMYIYENILCNQAMNKIFDKYNLPKPIHGLRVVVFDRHSYLKELLLFD
jgi:hypothetical protein